MLSRELKRNSSPTGKYIWFKAHDKAMERRKLKYRHGPKRKAFPIADRTSIHQRPEEANGKRFGDFEMDLIVDRYNHVILTLV